MDHQVAPLPQSQNASQSECDTDQQMSSPYKEWDSLSHLLYLIPAKGQRTISLSVHDIIMTGLDICGDLLAVGSNMAVVYIIGRRRRRLLLKLKCGNMNDDITQLSLSESCEGGDSYCIAAGTRSGQIFYSPFKLPDTSANIDVEVISCLQTSVVNSSCITSIQTAADWQTVYVGDETGVVTAVDIGTSEKKLKQTVLLTETEPVVQLSLWDQLLLLSTTTASLIFNLTTKEITKLGTKPRKPPGSYGACFHMAANSEPLIFSARPGLRLWKCSAESGTVLVTHMFKNLVDKAPSIKLNGETTQRSGNSVRQFGIVKVVDSSTLVSCTDKTLIILDISEGSKLLGVCSSSSTIIDVACSSGEIFILGGEGTTRRLHRLATSPAPTHLAQPSYSISSSQELKLSPGSSPSTQKEENGTRTSAADLPPIVQSIDLRELSLSDNHEAQRADGSEVTGEPESTEIDEQTAKDKLKKIEEKFQTGFTSVKQKLTASGGEIKQVGQSVKLGFGSLFNKIQSAVPSRKAKSERGSEEVLSETASAEVTKSAVQLLAPEIRVGDTTNTFNYTDMSSIGSGPASPDVDEDLVIRLVPGKGSRSWNAVADFCQLPPLQPLQPPQPPQPLQHMDSSASVDRQRIQGLEKCVTANEIPVTDNLANEIADADTLAFQNADTDNIAPPSSQLTDSYNETSKHASTNSQQSSSHTTSDNLVAASTYSDIATSQSVDPPAAADQSYHESALTDQSYHESALTDQSYHEPNVTDQLDEESDSTDQLDEEAVAAEDLMSRLNAIVGSQHAQTKHSFDFLKSSIECEQYSQIQSGCEGKRFLARSALSSDILPTGVLSSDGTVETGNDVSSAEDSDADSRKHSTSICEEFSDSDEEDIYKTSSHLTDTHAAKLKKRRLETGKTRSELPKISDYSKLVTQENWGSYTIMSSTPSSITLASNYMWMIDKGGAIWVAKYADYSPVWKKLDIKGQCLSAAPSGSLAWRVHKGTAYAGNCRHPPYTPWNMKWTKAVEGVNSVSVDEHCAWYIKSNGEVWLQSNLSKERPIKHGTQIACKYSLSKLSSRGGVTWALSKQGGLYFYHPNSTGGLHNWQTIQEVNTIADISVSQDGSMCWLVDTEDILWCITDVSITNMSVTSLNIWQVNYEGYMKIRGKHHRGLGGAGGGAAGRAGGRRVGVASQHQQLVAACDDLISISHSGSNQDVHVCRTHSIGYRWNPLLLSNLSASSKWRQVSSVDNGKMFAVYESGEIFYIDIAEGVATGVNLPPDTGTNSKVTYMTSCSLSIWLVMSDGSVFYNTDVCNSDSIRLGLTWRQLNTILFGDHRVKQLTVGSNSAWAVDYLGSILMSVGVNVKREGHNKMSPAWIPVNSESRSCEFAAVYINDKSSMVWAVDTKGYVYVRRGVSTHLPIGTSWLHLDGIKVKELCVSEDMVWAVTADSNSLLCRVGITGDLIEGDYWKKIPSKVCHVAALPSNEVLGLSVTGELLQLTTKVIGKVTETSGSATEQLTDGDWELL